MKFFALVFNVYLFALSFFPCADVDYCDENTGIATSLSPMHKTENRPGVENCTPFCICACCTTSIINEMVYKQETSKQIYAAFKFPSIQILYPSQTIAAVWQPPKFC